MAWEWKGNQFSGNFLRNASPANSPAHGSPGKINQPTTLTLTDLPLHTSIDISMLLGIIDSWDGANTANSHNPDNFNITVDGTSVFSEAFSEEYFDSANRPQTYIPPTGGALAVNTQLGFTTSGGRFFDSAYDLGVDPTFAGIPHSGSTLKIEWFADGAGWAGGSDESWAIDNLEVRLNLDVMTLDEDADLQTVNLRGITAGRGEVQPLRITASSDNMDLIPSPTVTYTSAATTGSIAFTPLPNQFGTATITVTVEDSGLDGDLATAPDNATTSRTFDVTVNPVNDVPHVAHLSNLTIQEDSDEIIIPLTDVNAGGGEVQPLRVTADSSDTDLIPNPTVDYTTADATGSIAFTPVADQSGIATITVTVEDGGLDGNLDTAGDNATFIRTFDVTVEPQGSISGLVFNDLNNDGQMHGRRTQAFDNDPNWTGERNKSNGNDFGYSATHYADGQATGEVGGQFARTSTGGFYRDTELASTLTLDTPFHASGVFSIKTISNPNNDFRIGFFGQGYLVFAIGELGPGGVDASDQPHNTLRVVTRSSLYTTNPLLIKNAVDHGSRTWSLDYNPDVGDYGQVVFLISGPTKIATGHESHGRDDVLESSDTSGSITVNLTQSMRANSLSLTSFGFASHDMGSTGEQYIEAYFDDITYTTKTNDPGVAGITVYLDDNNNGAFDAGERTTVTRTDNQGTNNVNEGGQYQFTDVHAGNYTVRLIGSGADFSPGNNESFRTVTVVSGTESFGNDFGIFNDVPTLAGISNVTINEDASQQTVNLTGITAGGGETQPLRVTATSSNTDLILDPTVVYSNAAATGTLSFTSAGRSIWQHHDHGDGRRRWPGQ